MAGAVFTLGQLAEELVAACAAMPPESSTGLPLCGRLARLS